MANPFLNKTDLMDRDVETALLLEQAITHDIGKAVAYTDGNKIYVNTEDNLNDILPAYDYRMLKWLLWHERMHMELKHHNRFFKYVKEFEEATKTSTEAFSDTAIELHAKKFNVSKEEVNIIMDILVHDWMSTKFPELVEVAQVNCAQFRNRNSLGYTFKTFTLEEMLDEYAKHKHGDDKDGEGTGDGESEGEGDEDKDGKGKGDKKEDDKKKDDKKKDDTTSEPMKKKGHAGESKTDLPTKGKDKPEDDEKPEENKESERPLPDEHDKTDWSKLEDRDSKEFITEAEGDDIQDAVARLKRKKFKLAKVTETLNGLVTSQRTRTYAKPNPIKIGGGVVLKGSKPGRTQLYIVFDASGSMGTELATFKEIISKSIPQAMHMPCEWFAGCNEKIPSYKREYGDGYFKGTFEDIMPVWAQSGYSDDGDRVIELCWQAEQLGYSPIGVTDGGGQISWSRDKLKQLKRTVLVGQNERWLNLAKSVNPRIQTLYI